MDWAIVFLSTWLTGRGVRGWVMLWGSTLSLDFSIQSATICIWLLGWLALPYTLYNVLVLVSYIVFNAALAS